MSITIVPDGTPDMPLHLRPALVLSLEDVEAFAEHFAGTRIGDAAQAWLNAYRNALWLGFGEIFARKQAAFAWDQSCTAPYLIHPQDVA